MDTLTPPVAEPDPIDLLIPPARPWWARLTIALLAVGIVATGAVLVGFGYVFPRPDCCGSGGGSAVVGLAPGGTSVIVQAYAYNSSGRDLLIEAADAVLPGATVLGVTVLDEPSSAPFEVARGAALPATWSGHGSLRIAIEFVPESCARVEPEWGSIALDLDVENAWLPSIDRTYVLPDAVVGTSTGGVSVVPPDESRDWWAIQDPLEAAYAMLDTVPS